LANFWQRLIGAEKRAISFQSIWGAGDSLAWQSDSGASVTPDSSFGVVPFYAAVNLISGTISTLPLDTFVRKNGERVPYRPKPDWVLRPDIDLVSGQAHWQQVIISLLVWGNSYVRIFRDPDTLEIVNLVALDPTLVDVTRGVNGRKIYHYKGEEGKALTSDDVLHITDMMLPGALKGKGRVEALKENLGLGIALQAFAARFFGGGATTAGIIEYPGTLAKEQAKSLVEGFDSAHRGCRRAHKTGILTGGAKYVQTSTPNDANQFLQSREFATLDIARAFQIPPFLLGVTGQSPYASVEQMSQDFATHTLRPLVEKLEQAYSTLLPNQAFIKFNLDGLIRADFATRMQGYSVAIQGGWMSINDIHRLEDWKPIDGGDVYRVPLSNVNLNAADLTEKEAKVKMASDLILAGFKPEDVLKALELPNIPHSGVPPVKLQQVQNINPANPDTVYEVK
jgi:HK97 family phage portal protein